jgi:hypothetical protein
LTLSLELEVPSFEFEGDLLGRAKSEFSDTDTFIKDEIGELFGLAEALCARANTYQALFHQLIAEMRPRVQASQDAAELERLSEEFARALRHLWIEASVSSASQSYRSPPTDDQTTTATGRNIEFGYERDLQPTYLEERCAGFFMEPPEGWTSDHVLLSSGQSAMVAALHALESGSLIGGDRRLSFVHLGAYFETAEIFSLFSSLLKPLGTGRQAVKAMDQLDADVFIIEPVFCDGEFGSVNVAKIVQLHREKPRRRVYIFDTTLTGSSYSLEKDLAGMSPLKPPVVFRLVSGLKLLQGGLELASVGILSVFTPKDAVVSAKELGNKVRKIRTLLGSGLAFGDVAALEAPWFLDREYSRVYQQAIFENNARLAAAVSANNFLFRGTFHPSMLPEWQGPQDAPYCAFRLQNGDPLTYARLEEKIRSEVQKRGILFESGGSFGFRGHRFDLVKPEDSEPFLRVALGRRFGWSSDQIIRLFSELASSPL